MKASANRAARRAQLAELAFNVIGREGLDAATIRRLASEAGYSTKAVTHYYPNKRALLLDAYEWCAQRADDRVKSVTAAHADSIQDALEALLPIGEEARTGWRVNLAFWHLATEDKEFAATQLWWTDYCEHQISAILDANAAWDGDTASMARYLVTLVEGMAVRAAFDAQWTDEMQRTILTDVLRPFGLAREI